jgi:hypothetical protein
MYPHHTGPGRPLPRQSVTPGASGGVEQAFPTRYPTVRTGLRDMPPGLLAACVSTGFGVLQILAPRTLERTIGMSYPLWVIRLIGLRDLALGLAMLARPASPRWLWVRVGNDLFDCGIIAGAAFVRGVRRRRLAGFAAFAAGIVALDLRAARRASAQ